MAGKPKPKKKSAGIYRWKDEARLPRSAAQSVGETLAELALAKGGEPVTADDVWQHAHANRDSALGKLFEWDVQKAARLHWQSRARYIISCCVVVESTPQGPVRCKAFINSSKGEGTRGYYPAPTVISSAELRHQAVRSLVSDLNAVRKRFSHYTFLARHLGQLEELVENFQAQGVEEMAASTVS